MATIIKDLITWFTPNLQLTYNRIYNFVIGVRGGGKTFNLLKYSIEKYLKDGSEFIYLRRHVTQLDEACISGKDGDLFAYLRYEGYFSDHELKVKANKSGGYNFYCDGKLMGYGKALITSMSRKSLALPNVKLIIYDEFIIDDKVGNREKYLGGGEGEVFIFNNFYETVTRGRDIPVFFIANAFSMVNPYFTHYQIRFQPDGSNRVHKGKFWTCIVWSHKSFIKERSKTQFYQANVGTKFHDHAFNNSFYMDVKDFISKRDPDSEHHFSVVYLGKTYGVWVNWNAGKYYISTKGASTSPQKTISMSLADNKPNNVNIRRYKNYPFIKAFRLAFDTNSVYYDTQETYNNMNEILYLLKTTN